MKLTQPPLDKSITGQYKAWLTQMVQALNSQIVPAPATSTSPGTPNQFAYDTSYFYVCIAPNTWVRTPLATF